jgi:hypothetical protein
MRKITWFVLSFIIIIAIGFTVFAVNNQRTTYVYHGYSKMPIDIALQIVNEQQLENNAIVAVSDNDSVYLSYSFETESNNSYGLTPSSNYTDAALSIGSIWFVCILIGIFSYNILEQ